MKNGTKIIVLWAIMSFFTTSAQVFELGKVTKAELEEKTHLLEPGAAAAVLYEDGTTYLDYNESEGFFLVTETEVRIKIYTKEGYDWANKSVRYYVAQNPTESLQFSKAVTYNLVNGAIEKTKLKNDGEFTQAVNKYWSVKKIAMPNVREGSIIEYKYVLKSPYTTNFPTWTFQNSIPVNFSKFVTRIPEYYIFKTNQKGYLFPKVETSGAVRSHTVTSKQSAGKHISKTSYDNFEYNEKITTYTAEKMPSMKDEDYVNNINNYTSSIEHELSMTKFPNSPIKSYSSTWEDVVKTIYDSDGFGAELKKNNYFETDLQPILATCSTRDEKISAIFNYVKKTMNWNGYHSYTCDNGVRKAYKEKVGDSAEINLMLTAMLRFAGIDASPVLVSTRSNGISIFPNRTAFNYVIAAVEIENGLIFLDATDKYALPNIMPIRVLNWSGRLIRVDGSSTSVDLMPKTNSKEIINLIATLDAEGKLKGMIRDQYLDYNAFLYRVRFHGVAKENYLEKLEQKYKGLEIGDHKTVDDDFSKPVVESYSFAHNSSAELIGDKMYFSPLLFFTQEENPFKQDKREYPVDFVFPHQDKYAFTINIPEGYVVESTPQPLSLSMENNFGNFKFNISATQKQIQILTTLDINEVIITPEDYQILQDFYKKMIEKQNEKIVLKKA